MEPCSLDDFLGTADMSGDASEIQADIPDMPKKPLPFFLEAAKHIETAGYKSGWINRNVDVRETLTRILSIPGIGTGTKANVHISRASGCPAAFHL